MIWASSKANPNRKGSYDSQAGRRRNSGASTASSTSASTPGAPSDAAPHSRKSSLAMSDQHQHHHRRPSLSAVSPNANPPTSASLYSHADLYTVNSLNSFSFGNAHSSGSAGTSPVSPLDESTDDDDGDGDDDDDAGNAFDTTPRPSVADATTTHPRRSHSSQTSPGPSSRRRRHPSSDAASHHTFGTSSASGSVASLTGSDGVEFDDYMYYSDEERIEVSSAMYSERRVSLPIAVPDARDREGSILTLRRPSKSLDADSPLAHAAARPDDPNSLPESDGDWKSLRARKGKAADTATLTAPPITVLTAPAISQDFDPDWGAITRGITSFDQPPFAAQPESRRGSATSIFPWARRPSTATTASLFSNDDPFFRAVNNWAPDYREQRRAWSFARERADASASPTSPTSKKARSSLGDTSKFTATSYREKEAWRSPANWKGMPVDSQELWANELVGRFKVTRKSIPHDKQQEDGSAKGPIQRLCVDHFRDGFSKGNVKHDDPSIIVHKHSKTVAFSISRFYKPAKGRSNHSGRKMMSLNMILLAPRKVQEAYTSTTSTRKLESHGLLEDDRPKRREGSQPPRRRRTATATDPTSSSGSVSSSSRPSSSSGSTPPVPSIPRRPRKSSWDSDEETVPPRTPHSEAYGTVDAAQLDQLRQHQKQHPPAHAADDNAGFLARIFRTRRQELPSPRMKVYDPAWVTLEPRNKQEQTQRVVENLNHSFQEVGLLQVNRPRSTKGKEKPARRRNANTRGEGGGGGGWQEVFREIPDDVLYMLLPLWPCDTDPVTLATEEYARPQVERQYLLVCYKAAPPAPPPSASSPVKKTSPTSSGEARERERERERGERERERDERNILLPAFNITGRLVSHRDIHGSGMRVSEGIAVNGPMREAFARLPHNVVSSPTHASPFPHSSPFPHPSSHSSSYPTPTPTHYIPPTPTHYIPPTTTTELIGICRSREAGVEFIPDGLVNLGLCEVHNAYPPGTIAEEAEALGWTERPEAALTPVGRAVVEMAWVGGLAVTSF